MPTTTAEPTTEDQDAVAAYATADGAERAVAQLLTLGYDEDHVALAPRDFDVEDPHPLRRRLGTGARVGALVGACVAGAVQAFRTIGLDVIVGTVLPVVGVTMLVGASLGLLIGVIVHRRIRALTWADPGRLVPSRYEVVVDHEPARARHGLARWWDPAARPVSRRGGAWWKRSHDQIS